MTHRAVPSRHAIAVSISESSDMSMLGLSNEHLIDAFAEISRYVLNSGSRLVYGGDLRQYGFSELLFEIVARHQPVLDDVGGNVGVTNYFAWPVHILMSYEKLEESADALVGSAELVCLDLDGKPMTMKKRRKLKSRQPTDVEWQKGLTAMRRRVLGETTARIVLGGRTEQYKGVMPGIGEEALLSLQARQPLFVIGGFGGCARSIAESLGIAKQQTYINSNWPAKKAFDSFSSADLNNGLTVEDNATLAVTPHIDQAIILILRGLRKVVGTRSNE